MTQRIPAWVGDELEPVEKLEVHRRGLRHPAVSVFVMAGQETLIQQRALGKYHTPGLWTNTCCTHPSWGEHPRACAIRRTREEIGIDGLDPWHCGRVEYRADVGNGLVEHEVVDIFCAEVDRDISFSPNPAEVKATMWIRIDDLTREAMRRPERFTPWLHVYLDNHRETIFGATA